MATILSKKTIEEVFDLKKKKEIVKVVVSIAQVNQETNAEELIADYHGVKMIVPKSELDVKVQYKAVVHFVGTEIGVVILSFDAEQGVAICSRAEAQKISMPKTIEALENGDILEGSVVNIFPYGAYVDVDGCTGLLKNQDFAIDVTPVSEVMKIGDKIRVKLKHYSKNENLIFEAEEKYVSPNAINVDALQVGQIVLGVVRSRKPFGYFINIAPGLDVLTSSDLDEEVREEQRVQIKILKVYTADGKVRARGVIKRVL